MIKSVITILFFTLIASSCKENESSNNTQELIEKQEKNYNEIFLGFNDGMDYYGIQNHLKEISKKGTIGISEYNNHRYRFSLKDTVLAFKMTFFSENNVIGVDKAFDGSRAFYPTDRQARLDRVVLERDYVQDLFEIEKLQNEILEMYKTKYKLEEFQYSIGNQYCYDERGAETFKEIIKRHKDESYRRSVPDTKYRIYFNRDINILIETKYMYYCEDDAKRSHLNSLKITYCTPKVFKSELEFHYSFTKESTDEEKKIEEKKELLKKENEFKKRQMISNQNKEDI